MDKGSLHDMSLMEDFDHYSYISYENRNQAEARLVSSEDMDMDSINDINKTITDISSNIYISSYSLNPEETELRCLLSDWKLEQLASELIAQKVYVNILKIMKRHHIEKLLKNYDMGTIISFEHSLELWRESIGFPLQHLPGTELSHYNSGLSSPVSAGRSGSRLSTPPRTPYERSPTPTYMTDDDGVELSTILNETLRGKMLLEYYEKFSKFNEEQRSSLISTISHFYHENGLKMSLGMSYKMERQILERFPSEKLEYYRMNKRGKLYTKYSNIVSTFKSAVSKHISKIEVKEGDSKKKSRHQGALEPEVDAESCIRSLKYDDLSADEFDRTWKACSQYRLDYIKSNSTASIMEMWPFYRNPSGFRLVDMDFNTSFGNGDGLLKNWETDKEHILNFLMVDNHIKDRSLKKIVEKLGVTSDITENGHDAAIFWALHGYLVPTSRVVKKDLTSGRNTTTKFTIKDSQESVIFVGRNQQEVEERIGHLKKTKTSVQPSIFCIGQDIFSVKEIFVFFDDIRYKFSNMLRAFDICFKIIYLFDLEFPAEAVMFYSFVASNYFKFKIPNKFSKVEILCEYLNEKNRSE